MHAYYKVGKIVNTHGIQGEVRVITISDFAEERYAIGSTLYLFTEADQMVKPLTVRSYRQHKNFDLLTFKDHPSINDVEMYKGYILKVAGEDLTELAEDEYYYHEIIGCQVYSQDEEHLGEITEILSNSAANDVWVIKPVSKERKKELLIPYIEDVVKEVDTAQKKVIIQVIEGLLE